jgi:hypothetical protein
LAFYTYLWLREDGTPYYVGKGHGNRAFDWHRRFRTPPRDRIIIQEHLSEADAFAAEVFLIAFYGRKNLETGCLRNLTDGGEGPSGQVMSESFRRFHSARLKANPFPPHSPEMKEQIRQKLIGIKRSASFCEKNRARMKANNPFRGKTHTPEVLKIMSEAAKRRSQNPEYRKMQSEAGKRGAAARWGKTK